MFPKLLKVSVLNYRYFSEVQKNEYNQTVISGGANGFLLQDLSKHMKFDYELYTPKDGQFGYINSDGEWTGMLGMLARGEVNLALMHFLINEDRYDHFHMIPFTSHRYAFATNKPTFRGAESRFERPFHSEVWISCVLSYVLTAILLWIFAHFCRLFEKECLHTSKSTFWIPKNKQRPYFSTSTLSGRGLKASWLKQIFKFSTRRREEDLSARDLQVKRPKWKQKNLSKRQNRKFSQQCKLCKVAIVKSGNTIQRRSKKSVSFQHLTKMKRIYNQQIKVLSNSVSFSNVCFEAVRITLRQNLSLQKTRKYSLRIVLGTWMIASMFLTYSYSGVLLSFMTLPLMSEPIKTVQQLADAIKNHNFKLYTPLSKAATEVIRSNPILNGLDEKIKERTWSSRVEKDGILQNFDSDSAVTGTTEHLKLSYGVEPFATKFIPDEIISVAPAGMAVSKTFCCKNELQWRLLRTVETGIYQTYWDYYLTKAILNRTLKPEQLPVRPLSFHDFDSMFHFLMCGLALAGVVLLLEMFSVTKFYRKIS